VIANSLFAKAVDDTVLIVSQALDPSAHVRKHFPLDFRPRIMKIRMKAGTHTIDSMSGRKVAGKKGRTGILEFHR
jgi:hypothetical protein